MKTKQIKVAIRPFADQDWHLFLTHPMDPSNHSREEFLRGDLRRLITEFASFTSIQTTLYSFPDWEEICSSGHPCICEKYHKACPALAPHCAAIFEKLKGTIGENGTFTMQICPCENGLVEAVVPVRVREKICAVLLMGSVFLNPPSLEFHKRLAEENGLPVEQYLDAVRLSPVLTKEQFQKALDFLKVLAEAVGSLLEKAVTNERAALYFEALSENSPAVIYQCETDPPWRVSFISDACTEFFGYPKEAFLGENAIPLQDLVHPEDLPLIQEEVDRALSENRPYQLEFRMLRADGTKIWVLERGHVVDAPDQEAPMLQGVYLDISATKKFELELIDARDRAEAATRAKAAFLATMSHEIRTPLNGVIGYLSLLSESGLSAEQIEFCKAAQSSSESLLEIINEILDFSKMEAGGLALENVLFSPGRELHDSARTVAPAAAAKDIDLCIYCPPDAPPAIHGDPKRFRQILTNLLGNAVKFTTSGSVLVEMKTVFDERSKGSIEIRVIDTGCGIPDEFRSRIFQPYHQARTNSSSRYEGTGLGLAISHQLARLMGGSLELESSNPGTGTTFLFKLPLAADCTPGLPIASPPVRTLLFEPRPASMRTLSRILRDANSEVVAVGSVDAAVAALENRRFDFAIIDGMQPCDALKKVRQALAGGAPPHPVSVQLLPVNAGSCRSLEADHTLVKPVNPAALHKLVQSPPGRPASALRKERVQSFLPDNLSMEHPLSIIVAEDTPSNQIFITALLERLGYNPTMVRDGVELVEALKKKAFDLVLMDIRMPRMDGVSAARYIRKSLPSDRQPYIIAVTAHAPVEEGNPFAEDQIDACLFKPVLPEQMVTALRKAPAAAA